MILGNLSSFYIFREKRGNAWVGAVRGREKRYELISKSCRRTLCVGGFSFVLPLAEKPETDITNKLKKKKKKEEMRVFFFALGIAETRRWRRRRRR